MREIRTSGLMSGEGKRDASMPSMRTPRPSSTLLKVWGVVGRVGSVAWTRAASRRLFRRWNWFWFEALGVCGTGLRCGVPRRSWTSRHQPDGELAEECGIGTSCGEGELDAGGGFSDAGAELEEAHADGGELGGGQDVRRGDGVAQGEDQPVGSGVQDQPHLVGERAAAAGAVGSELRLVQFDQVFGLAAGAVDGFVDLLGRSGLEAGNDEADVEALGGGLDAGTGAALGVPRFGAVAGFGEAAQAGLLIERPAGADVVGDFIDRAVEHGVAGQAKDEVEPVLLAPFHDLGAAVMAVAADGDAGQRPVPADAADEAA